MYNSMSTSPPEYRRASASSTTFVSTTHVSSVSSSVSAVGTDDLVETLVGVHDAPVEVELHDADGQGSGQTAQELFARPHQLVGLHLLGDVEHLAVDVARFGIVEQVVVGELEPDPAAVAVAVPEPRPAGVAGPADTLHPHVDGPLVIVGMDELERAVPDDLGFVPAEHRRHGRLGVGDHGYLVLPRPREAGRDRSDLGGISER